MLKHSNVKSIKYGSPSFPSDSRSLCSYESGSTVVSAAPSALREGKYSSANKLARIDFDGASSLASSSVTDMSYQKASNHERMQNQFRKRSKGRGRKNKSHISYSGGSSQRSVSSFQSSPTSVQALHYFDEPQHHHGVHHGLPSYTTLPNGTSIGDVGFILGRCSKLSIMFKKQWRRMVWVHCKPASIIIFRSVDDANVWMKSQFIDDKENGKLVKSTIDLDPMGKLDKKRNKNQESNLDAYKPNVVKCVMTDVHSKRSSSDASLV